MKMGKSIIKFKCLSYRGKRLTVKETIEHPSFEDEPFVLHGIHFTHTKACKIIDYIDNIDKSYLMNKHDLGCILDYSIHEVKTKQKTDKKKAFLDYLDLYSVSHSIKFDIIACFVNQYEHIKSLSIDKQLNICIESASIGYKSIIYNYKRMDEISYISKNKVKKEGVDAFYLQNFAKQLRIEIGNNNNIIEK